MVFKKFSKKFLATTFAQKVLSWIAYTYINFVYSTSRWQYNGQDIFETYIKEQKPFIVSFWHGHLLMLACAWQWKTPFYMLISNHRDGRIIAKTMHHFGIRTIVGSTDKKGFEAARQMLKVLKENGVVGITPDGPRGPREEISEGIIRLAALAQVDIIPIAYSVSPLKKLNSWDQFRIARPFGKGVFVIGKPITFTKDLALLKQHLVVGMNKTVEKADNLVQK